MSSPRAVLARCFLQADRFEHPVSRLLNYILSSPACFAALICRYTTRFVSGTLMSREIVLLASHHRRAWVFESKLWQPQYHRANRRAGRAKHMRFEFRREATLFWGVRLQGSQSIGASKIDRSSRAERQENLPPWKVETPYVELGTACVAVCRMCVHAFLS